MSTVKTVPKNLGGKSARLLVVTELFPNPGHTYSGSFVVEQLRELARSYTIDVVVPYYVPMRSFFTSPSVPTELDVRVTFVRLYAYDLYALYILRLISFDKLKLRIKHRSARALVRVAKKQHRQNPYRFVHGHEMYVGDEAGPIGKTLSIPSVITIHGLYPFHKKVFGYSSMQQSLQNLHSINQVIAVSTIVSKSYQALGVPKDKFVIIPNGVTPPKSGPNLRYKLGIPADSLVLLSVGLFTPLKRFSYSIYSLKHLHTAGHVDSHLVLVGAGPEENDLRKLVAELELQKNVHFVGKINPTSMGAAYRTASILLHPSINDSFSMACLEAMSYGLPVVCTDAIGIVEYLNRNQDALVVAADDKQAFTQATLELANSAHQRHQIGQAGKKVADKLSWNSVIIQLQKIYQNLLSHAE